MRRVAALLALLALACGCAGVRLMPERRGGVVHFRIRAPGATRASLVGTFNRWTPSSSPMSTRDGELWEAAVSLAPGRHSYVFLVDDLPVRPPEAPMYEDDGFGGENGVIEIR